MERLGHTHQRHCTIYLETKAAALMKRIACQVLSVRVNLLCFGFMWNPVATGNTTQVDGRRDSIKYQQIANSESKCDTGNQESQAEERPAYTAVQWPKTNLKIHHGLLPEMQAEAFGMAIAKWPKNISHTRVDRLLAGYKIHLQAVISTEGCVTKYWFSRVVQTFAFFFSYVMSSSNIM